MKYFFIAVIILGIGAGYYYWSLSTQSVLVEDVVEIDVKPTTPQETEDAPQIKLDHQTYQNKEWDIVFEYPNDWEIREPAFYSTVSKLNLSVEPMNERKYPETILINITPKEWIESAMVKMKKDNIVFTDGVVAGFDAIRFESAYEGAPQIDYLILINNTYWINISGKKEYEDILNQVLESFVITPVEVSVEGR